MTTSVLVLGAGFGGLEIATRLTAAGLDVTVVDQSPTFYFGFSKLDVLFGRQTGEQARIPYGAMVRRERVLSIDPAQRRVVTDADTYQPDVLVVALGADYDPAATPGFVEDGFEFYSMHGAERLRDRLAGFTGGDIVLAVLGVPFKCPPAPYEGALLLHEQLVERGLWERSSLTVVSPMDSPIPVSGSTSEAIVAALTARGIGYLPGRRVRALDPATHVAQTKDGDLPYDLFIGVPVHCAPQVVVASGLTEGGADGWVKVDPKTLQTPYDGVYALGDCADAPVPRAGVFAESAARAAADHILSTLGGPEARPFDGTGTCYVEFGGGRVGKVEVDFLSGPSVVAPFSGPTSELVAEKAAAAAAHRKRWFGLD